MFVYVKYLFNAGVCMQLKIETLGSQSKKKLLTANCLLLTEDCLLLPISYFLFPISYFLLTPHIILRLKVIIREAISGHRDFRLVA